MAAVNPVKLDGKTAGLLDGYEAPSFRDLLAASLMQTLMGTHPNFCDKGEWLAKQAFDAADAFIAERELRYAAVKRGP